jgi:hypothetical protein
MFAPPSNERMEPLASRASSRRRAITATILVVVGVTLYFLSSSVMDWLRVTIHGR